jgi:hypothetical protein
MTQLQGWLIIGLLAVIEVQLVMFFSDYRKTKK